MEEALNSNHEIMFYNSFGSFELIENGSQIFNPSIDYFVDMMKEKRIHMLCPSIDICKKLMNILKKNKIKLTIRKENYML